METQISSCKGIVCEYMEGMKGETLSSWESQIKLDAVTAQSIAEE